MLHRFTIFSLLFLFFTMPINAQDSDINKLNYQFGNKGCGGCDWFVVVDGVMGGLSTGELKANDDSVVLSGSISLANNGGFSSIRTPYQKMDLRAYKGVTIHYRSTGQNFAFTLNKHRRFWLPRFKAVLPETNGEWSTQRIAFNEFKKMRFDEILGGGPTERELGQIIRLGLISNDKREGPFKLEIKSISFD